MKISVRGLFSVWHTCKFDTFLEQVSTFFCTCQAVFSAGGCPLGGIAAPDCPRSAATLTGAAAPGAGTPGGPSWDFEDNEKLSLLLKQR